MLSIKAKVGLGILFSYTSFEVYMQLRTQYVIRRRKQEYQKLISTSNTDGVDFSKFKSATVAGTFVNPFEEYRPQTAFEFLMVRIMEAIESIYGNQFELHNKLPGGDTRDIEDVLKSHKPDLELLRHNSTILQKCLELNDFQNLDVTTSPSKGISAIFSKVAQPKLRDQMLFTWIGQSCALVQLSGINILTDPILSNHLISPSVGPKRLVPAPLSLEDINYATNNKVDFVLVSHDHPDHLELDLAKKVGNKTMWIVPLGLKKKLARKGIYNVIEMDWWDTLPLNGYIGNGTSNLTDKYEVTCVPAMHWSGRYVIDSNTSLWCSFIIRKNGESVLYHAGDTGYSKELFETIGKAFGPLKLSLLPIGQYCPSWHQKPRHISPAESVHIADHLNSKYVMGVHWGTFKISSEPILEPKYLLENIAKERNQSDFIQVPELGLTYLYDLKSDAPPQARK
ncbi:N-acyl-phosphatidylethanolamine-hydrolyzing phospholipase D, mitochondrial [[Candida] anglica]|uniref:N-acyl-phosphatidylethanolamine-hydrolyzing phospholipase D, mitochondrial n=1 Tax=[Candida] anglica TaxID=148631 RepID=A0ABP0E6T1_9ASCO